MGLALPSLMAGPPCPAPSINWNSTGMPLAKSASLKSSLCCQGIRGSWSPCTMRKGQVNVEICVMGLAWATLSGTSRTGPASNRLSGESGAAWSMLLLKFNMCIKSVGPKRSTTACTELLSCKWSPIVPSISALPLLAPRQEAKCPPAEAPITPILSAM